MNAIDIGTLTLAFHDAVAAVCPIAGVSLPDPADQKTWQIVFLTDATSDQETAAQQVLETWAGVPPPTPPDISDRQFAAGLWGAKIIDYDEFCAFIGPGTIPKAIQTILEQALKDDDTGAPTPRKNAVGFLTGSKLYEFDHPLVEVFRQALFESDSKWTPDYLRQQWLLWATL